MVIESSSMVCSMKHSRSRSGAVHCCQRPAQPHPAPGAAYEVKTDITCAY